MKNAREVKAVVDAYNEIKNKGFEQVSEFQAQLVAAGWRDGYSFSTASRVMDHAKLGEITISTTDLAQFGARYKSATALREERRNRDSRASAHRLMGW